MLYVRSSPIYNGFYDLTELASGFVTLDCLPTSNYQPDLTSCLNTLNTPRSDLFGLGAGFHFPDRFL